jgi:hypothetical protein
MLQCSSRSHGATTVLEPQFVTGPEAHDLLGLVWNDYGDPHGAMSWSAAHATLPGPTPSSQPCTLHEADTQLPHFRVHWRLWKHPEIA